MKKKLSLIMLMAMTLFVSTSVLASEESNQKIEQMSISEALEDTEILNYLIESGELDELYQVQEEIRENQYNVAATYARRTLGISKVSSSDVQYISEKYNLHLPEETMSGIIDNGTINVQRNSLGNIKDVWYIYYDISDSYFKIKGALIDFTNPLDIMTGTIKRYYLNNSSWTIKDSKPVNEGTITNGTIYTWYVYKWGVKEKIEYDITVTDNGSKHNFDNINEENYTRYNFEAKPYNSFTANGGQRHHFIPATSLRKNNYNSDTAYSIRMMTEDHKKTGSYGNSKYVSEMTSLLSKGRYQDALQKEVDNLQSQYDCEGIAGNLQQKYYNEVVTCLYQYENLFGIN